ncbi:hypothetical protein OsI_04742 [Oryza sativa Indica Group]|uniref:Uncharacterized protein n=2 Tax=Oryza TaxID=4527 RepID=B8A7D7_ORYSI|nr:hypothetical protein OsI_04742 [Oryza sativa Indica Group]
MLRLGGARPTSQPDPEADNNISGRPDFVDSFVQDMRPVPAIAAVAIMPETERGRTRTRATSPDHCTVYMPEAPPEMKYFARCFAYAYITAPAAGADGAAARADDDPTAPTRRLRFASPDDREASMEKQPFALVGDAAASAAAGGGASVKLVREGETSNCFRVRLDSVAHVALRHYPKDQRNHGDIERRCASFGHLLEVDPACYAAPDLSTVRVVVKNGSPREIPREIRIRYASDFRFWHVVPVQILKVWDKSLSFDANGEYVPIYTPAGAA